MKQKYQWYKVAIVLGLVFLTSNPSVFAEKVRLKNITNIRGFRSNQLLGYGLVIGLSATGDSSASLSTSKAASNLMKRLGMELTPEQASSKNIAAVIVTADLEAFKRNGDRVDVKVSAIGDATSLAGGTLLLTPLRAGDGQVYVVAQGAVVTGQASGEGSKVLTTALVPSGGVVEREFKPLVAPRGKIVLSLRQPDFTTSSRIADEINLYFKGFYARSLDPASVEIDIPPLYRDRKMEFFAELEGLEVDADRKAIVVINERTGTVVMGSDVVIERVSIAHGDLSVQIGGGKASSKGGGTEKKVVNMGGATVGSLIESMNALGVKPEDLVGILQAIKAAGALRAELRFM